MSITTIADRPVSYSYDNAHPTASVQHAALSRLLDAKTSARLRTVPLAGRTVLEVGAGGSRLPLWLAVEVGPTGSVTAVDIDPRHVPQHPAVQPVTRDITTDTPVGGPYDIIHARLLLMHLPDPHTVLARLAGALTPGGVLLVEDWLLWREHTVIAAARPADAGLWGTYQAAVIDILTGNGTQPYWAAHIHTAMRHAGLTDIDTVIDAPIWRAGTPGMDLVQVNIAQHRESLHAQGLTDVDLADVQRLATDPGSGLVVRGHLLYSTLGRRPTPPARPGDLDQ